MSKKPNIFISGFGQNCPNCGQGKLFVNPNPYNYKTMALMHDYCSNCGISFLSKEPGFYWGSMYVSYALTSGMVLFNLVWIHFFFGWDMWAIILPNVIMLLALAPLNFRISRAFWLSLNMRYFDKK